MLIFGSAVFCERRRDNQKRLNEQKHLSKLTAEEFFRSPVDSGKRPVLWPLLPISVFEL
jgi:hypothetical protein